MDKSGSFIVVGVDGTTASVAALTLAFREALIRGCEVRAFTAWTWPGQYEHLIEVTGPQERTRSARLQGDVVTAALAAVPSPPEYSLRLEQGDAAEVLLTAAAGAEFLVVGTGRKGPLRAVVLGSVSRRCVQHSPCPVIVVPWTGSSAGAAEATLQASQR